MKNNTYKSGLNLYICISASLWVLHIISNILFLGFSDSSLLITKTSFTTGCALYIISSVIFILACMDQGFRVGLSVIAYILNFIAEIISIISFSRHIYFSKGYIDLLDFSFWSLIVISLVSLACFVLILLYHLEVLKNLKPAIILILCLISLSLLAIVFEIIFPSSHDLNHGAMFIHFITYIILSFSLLAFFEGTNPSIFEKLKLVFKTKK